MKTGLVKFFCLFVPVAVFLAWHAWTFPEGSFSVHHRKAEIFKLTAAHTEVLILGTSHANEGILPEILHPKAFNLAHPSQTPNYDAQLIGKALEWNAPLKLVIIEVAPFSLGHKPVAHSAAKWTAYRYHSAYGFAMPDWRMNFEFRTYHPFFRHNRIFGIKEWIAGPKKGVELNSQGGFSGYLESLADQTSQERAAAARIRAATHQGVTNGPKSFAGLSHWEELFLGAKNRAEFKVAFVMMPFTPEYQELMQPWIQTARDRMVEFAELHSAVWLDLSLVPGLQYADFHDADHLNASGADKFTRALREALKEINLL